MQVSAPLFLGQRQDFLVDCLLFQWEKETPSPLGNHLVLVSNAYIKQWLLLEITKRRSIAMGLKILTVSEGLSWLLQKSASASAIPNRLELFTWIYTQLAETQDPSLQLYLEGKKGRLGDLSQQLTTLFCQYGQWEAALFSEDKEPGNWQEELLKKLSKETPWRLPVQVLPHAAPAQIDSLHCFCLEGIPSLFWNYFLSHTPVSIYQFSPCMHFWEDVCSDRERRNLTRYWKKKKASSARQKDLETYLRDAPSLLANWGKVGRQTLKELGRWELSIEEVYASLPTTSRSLLQTLQADLLDYEIPLEPRPFVSQDRSIQIALCGSSRLREIEVLRDQILSLHQEQGIAFSDMVVLAPQLDPYVPLIEWIFQDPSTPLPFRIYGVDCSSQSSVYQGLMRILALANGRWEKEDLLALLETPAFYRKQGWDAETVERLREWLMQSPVQWGLDATHRKKCVQDTIGETKEVLLQGCWEQALDRWLQQTIFLFPQETLQKKERFTLDDFESFLEIFQNLKTDLAPFRQTQETLLSWANRLQQLVEKYLAFDTKSEADSAFSQSFLTLLQTLRKAEQKTPFQQQSPLFPFQAIHSFLTQSGSGQIQGAYLHAVRIACLEEGAGIPAKALFLIGMDELQFPRMQIPSSLDLLRHKKSALPERADLDRYLFLKALFSASDFLRISYNHLSPEEGKEVGPSLVVQELLSYIDRTFSSGKESVSSQLQITPPSLSFDHRCFSKEHPSWRSYAKRDYETAKAFYEGKQSPHLWPQIKKPPSVALSASTITLSIRELAQFARHPWRYALQKEQGIFLDESLKSSFPLQKAKILRASLTQPLADVFKQADDLLPSGLLGEALRLDIEEKAQEWQESLQEWEVKELFSLSYRDQAGRTAERVQAPLEMELEEGCRVRLIGEITLVSSQGLITTAEDSLAGALRIWPEALIVALTLQAPHIHFLKTGKKRQIEDPEHCLKQFLRYFLSCRAHPSLLLPDWAEALLRKGAAEWEKKWQATQSGHFQIEDPVAQWVLARIEPFDSAEVFAAWHPYLKELFEGFLSLYPTRAKGGTVAAL